MREEQQNATPQPDIPVNILMLCSKCIMIILYEKTINDVGLVTYRIQLDPLGSLALQYWHHLPSSFLLPMDLVLPQYCHSVRGVLIYRLDTKVEVSVF